MKGFTCFLALLITISVSGCTTYTDDTISAIALFSENVFEIPLENEHYPADERTNGMVFTSSSADLDAFFAQLGESGDYYFIPTGGWLIVMPTDDGRFDSYWLRSHATYWVFSNMSCVLISDDEKALCFVPLHLCDDARLQIRVSPDLYEGVEYETKYAIDDFYEFYLQTGWFNAHIEEDVLVLDGYDGEPIDAKEREYPLSYPLFTEFPMEIHFSWHHGQRYFTVVLP